MFNSLSLFIASRYSRSKQRNSFISFITFFSVAGITLGVLALIIVVSVMNGFESELKNRVLGVIPHIVIKQNAEHTTTEKHDFSLLTARDDVLGVTPFLQTESMIQSPTDMRAIMLQGINPQQAEQLSVIANHMVYGHINTLQPRRYNVIVGRALAGQLNLHVGDQVRLMLVEKTSYTPMGRMPVQRNFNVTGIFDAGSDVDSQVALIHYDDAARLLRKPKNSVTSHRIYLVDAFNYRDVNAFIAQQYPNLTSVDWRQSQGKLFSAVKMEKNMMWLMLCLIVAVAAFNIVSALVMVVSEKQGEIAMLKTMGLAPRPIQAIFILQGLYKGCIGALLGTILGVIITLFLNDILSLFGASIFAAPGYSVSGLPIDLRLPQVAVISVSAIAMSLLATLYPSYRAANTQPANVLRYE
ncbi:lipoprotein-releasing ABC transporter permease subunit [Algibacillus agarilyticus]|uniref:lipoprotein-releasing ABC transporter permease subunit n=1 Tax=Algibacillus agarilyticus TaxID=2234133 RepID=UPI000DCFCD4E|nr:lipoprotein-releasing ABC transporter permease subunit [Algibacillus agarilyticus]